MEKQRKGLSGSTLKLIAISTMLIDHTGAAVLGRFLTKYQLYNWSAVPEKYKPLVITYQIMRAIGRIAFPIFCYLLVEGFEHTHDRKKYAFRLAGFAVISEIPFDLAFSGKIVDLGYQNVFFTLWIGLLAMMLVDWIWKKERIPDILRVIFCGAAIVGCMALADKLSTDYSWIGVFCIMVLFLLRKKKKTQLIAGAISFAWEIWAPIAFLLLAFYNGKRGWKGKYFFYIFYPVHLFLLYLISAAMGMGAIAGA